MSLSFATDAVVSLRIFEGLLIAKISKAVLTKPAIKNQYTLSGVEFVANPVAIQREVMLLANELGFDFLLVKIFLPDNSIVTKQITAQEFIGENFMEIESMAGQTHYPAEIVLGPVEARGTYNVLISEHVRESDTTQKVGNAGEGIMASTVLVVAPGPGVLSMTNKPTVSFDGSNIRTVTNVRLNVVLPQDNGGADISEVSFLFSSISIDVTKTHSYYRTLSVTAAERKSGFLTRTITGLTPLDSTTDLNVACYLSHGVFSSGISNIVLVDRSARPATPVLLKALSGLDKKIDISFRAAEFTKASVLIRKNNTGNYFQSDILNKAYSTFEQNDADEYLASVTTYGTALLERGETYEILVILHTEDLHNDVTLTVTELNAVPPLATQSINSNVLTAIPSLKQTESAIERKGLNLVTGTEAATNKYEISFQENVEPTNLNNSTLVSLYSIFKNDVKLVENKGIEFASTVRKLTFTSELKSTDEIKLVLVKRGVRIEKVRLPNILNKDDVVFTFNGLNYLTLVPKDETEVSAVYRLDFVKDGIVPVIKNVFEAFDNSSQPVPRLLVQTETPAELPANVKIKEVVYTVFDGPTSHTQTVTVTDNVLEFQRLDNLVSALVLAANKTYFVSVKYKFEDTRNKDTVSTSDHVAGDESELFEYDTALTLSANVKSVATIQLSNGKLGFVKVDITKATPPANHTLRYYVVTLFSEDGAQIDNSRNVDPKSSTDGDAELFVELNDTFNNAPTKFIYRNTLITATVQAKYANNDNTTADIMGELQVSTPHLVAPDVTIIPNTVKIVLNNVASPKTIQIFADVNFGRLNADTQVLALVIVPHLDADSDKEFAAQLVRPAESTGKTFLTNVFRQDPDYDYSKLVVNILTTGPNSLNMVSFP